MTSKSDNQPILLDGKVLSSRMREEMRPIADRLKKTGFPPGLAVVLVGDNPASKLYVNQKEKACIEMGINSFTTRLPAATSEDDLLLLVDELNHREDVHGILAQLPLPSHINSSKIIESIHPDKDVDGLHPTNLGRLLAGKECFISCTPHGILKLLKAHDIPLKGSEVVVVGRSTIVGKPMAILLLQEHATVTICHSKTDNLRFHTTRADILVAAVGKEDLITADMVKNGAVVIDVGQNRTKDGKLVGDVDYDHVAPKVAAITPVPGGVGPMTITMLLFNTLLAANKKSGGLHA